MWRFLLVAAVLLGLVGLLVWAVIREDRQWEEFKAAHNCKKVSFVKGQPQAGYGYGTTTNGQAGQGVIITQQPDRTGWLCDDGVTYYR